MTSLRGEERILNPDTVLQGLAITVVGMGLVFLALGLIVLAMMLMGRYLRPRAASRDGAPGPGSESEERARVAAIAAALVLVAARDDSQRPGAWDVAALTDVTSAWQAAHRAQALARRP
jgi:Na+-transporting methylmalonyl-CoA/oxaloacetate decarboxylase gamma subunit